MRAAAAVGVKARPLPPVGLGTSPSASLSGRRAGGAVAATCAGRGERGGGGHLRAPRTGAGRGSGSHMRGRRAGRWRALRRAGEEGERVRETEEEA